MKIKFDPTLITALSFFLTYLRKVKLIKHLIIRPLTFIFNKLGKLFHFSKIIRNLRLYKIYRKVTKVFSFFNILLATIFFLMFSDFTVEDLMILLALLYRQIYDFLSHNVLGYIQNSYSLLKKRLMSLLEPTKVDNVKSKINKTLDRDFRDNIFASGYKIFNDNEYAPQEETPEVKSKPFYYSPYFYIPAFLVITGVTIYCYHDSISSVVTVLLAYFGFGDNDDNTPRPPRTESTDNKIGWLSDPSSSKPYKSAYGEVLHDPSFAPGSTAPPSRVMMSAQWDEKLRSFGNKKVIIISAIINNEEFSFHHNVLISNLTTFSDYYESVKDSITTNYDNGYPVDVIPLFKVRVWNMDEISNKKIKITKDATIITNKSSSKLDKITGFQNSMGNLTFKRLFSNFIRPIKAHNIDPTISNIATMDIETIDVKGFQVPIAISICYNELETMKSKIFLINSRAFTRDHNKAVNTLWKEFFNFITSKPSLFKNILNEFWNKTIDQKRDAIITVKVRDKNTSLYFTITPLQLVTYNDYNNFKNILFKTLYLRKDLVVNMNKIAFIYKNIDKNILYNKKELILDPRLSNALDFLKLDNINGYSLPVSMEISDWKSNNVGIEIHSKPTDFSIIQSIINSNITYKINFYKPSHKWIVNLVNVYDINKSSMPTLTFFDVRDKEDNHPNTFIRMGHKFIIHYIEGYKVNLINNL